MKTLICPYKLKIIVYKIYNEYDTKIGGFSALRFQKNQTGHVVYKQIYI